jgi:hypothetical protein
MVEALPSGVLIDQMQTNYDMRQLEKDERSRLKDERLKVRRPALHIAVLFFTARLREH